MLGLGATASVGLLVAFYTVPHVAQRINRFLDPASGDTFNIDIATESFVRGGWFGRGPGEGTIKRILPEGHTDFVFAVAGEEFGGADSGADRWEIVFMLDKICRCWRCRCVSKAT